MRTYGCLFSVCSSIEVNTFIVHLEQLLRNCTVVEGNLKVSLIDYPEKSWDDVSFPQLREITGYVLLYRLAGLKSLRNVFPGLAVIRGRTLFRDNALVIYENQDLEEIGLKSLLTIERGSVYIWKNTVLCYLDTIDWTKVTSVEFSYRNSIMENKDSQQCANQCPPYCRSFFDGKMVRNMCWTSQDCQQGMDCSAFRVERLMVSHLHMYSLPISDFHGEISYDVNDHSSLPCKYTSGILSVICI